jgi:hypothetical protein
MGSSTIASYKTGRVLLDAMCRTYDLLQCLLDSFLMNLSDDHGCLKLIVMRHDLSPMQLLVFRLLSAELEMRIWV